mmetsp:Transcript_36914/g.68408  ORF Transcript_36914/g.68408 Transcript_36914/m.68408 type:complete len:106 (+) Transcript_36914:99-416(+)
MANMGDRASPSILFSSLDVVTKIPRTRKKYQTNGGTTKSVTGSTTIADANAPATKNEMTKKSKRVVGSRSSLDPTSAENLFRILPSGLVSKNSTFALRTDLVISS